MPDELLVATRVDTSGLDTGLAQARAAVRVSLDDLKAQYKTASEQVKTATANMAQAEQQFGAMAQAGNQQAIGALKQYETELAQAQEAQKSAAIGIDLLNQKMRELNATVAHSVSEFSASSAAVRTLESSTGGSVRAAERFLTTTLGLGPVLQAAFPVFGAISLLEVVVNLADKFGELTRSVDEAYQAQLRYDELSKQLDKDFKNEVSRAAELTEKYNSLAHGPIFEFREQLDNARLSAAAHSREIEDLQGKLKGLQDRIAAGTVINTRAGLVTRVTDDAKAAGIEMEGVRKQIENAQIGLTNDLREAQVIQAQIHKQETEDAEKAAREAERIARQHAAEVKRGLDEFERQQRLALRNAVELSREFEREEQRHTLQMLSEYDKQLAAQRKQLEEQQAVLQERLRGMSDEVTGELEIQEALVKQRADLGAISKSEELRQLRDLHQAEIEEEIRYWKQMAEVYKAGGEATAKEYEAALNRIAALQRRAHIQGIEDDTAITKAQQQELKKREQSVRDYVHTVDVQLFSNLNKWILGQKTFAEAMRDTWNDIVMDVVVSIEKIIMKELEEYAVRQLLKLLGIDTASQAAKNAAEAAAQMAVAQANLARAETDALYMSIEQYGPILGTGIGLGLATAIKTAGEAMIVVPAFETGGIVANTQLVLAHGGEAILPQPLTSMLMNAAGKSNNTNTVTVHYAPVVNGTGSGNLKQVLNEHADHLGQIMRQQARTFNRGVA